jgi:hypothetical protein
MSYQVKAALSSDIILTEEQVVIILPPLHHHRPTLRKRNTYISEHQYSFGPTTSNLDAAQPNTLAAFASGIDTNQLHDNYFTLSMDAPSSFGRNSIESTNTNIGMNTYLNYTLELDLDLGDLGLQNMVGECSQPTGDGEHGSWGYHS